MKVKTTLLRMLLADTGHVGDSFGRHSLPFSLMNSDVPRRTSLQRVYCVGHNTNRLLP